MKTTFTDAPEDYDGFGTKTIQTVGTTRRGRSVRQVRTPDSAIEWQRMRYGSGLYLALPEDRWIDARDGFLV